MWRIGNKGKQILSNAVEATLRGKTVAWPKSATTEITRRLAENMHLCQQELASSKQRNQQLCKEIEILSKRLHLVSEASTDGLYDIDLTLGDPYSPGYPAWWSNQIRRSLGYSEQEFPDLVSSWFTYVHPDDMEITIKSYSDHLADSTLETPYAPLVRVKDKSGKYRWFQSHGTTERDAQGVAVRFAGSISEVTEKLKREKEQEVTLARFELGTKMINDGIWDVITFEGDPFHPQSVVWFSQQLREMLEFTSEHDFPNKLDSWTSRMHPEDKDYTLNKLVTAVLDHNYHGIVDVEYRLQLKSGEYRWFRSRALTKRDANGVPLHIVGALLDIEAERKLVNVANTLNTAAEEIVGSNEDLSRRTEQQAAALEETASSMEEMTSIVRTNSDGALQAKQLAVNATETATRGGELVDGVINTMAEIQTAASKIADIITVIDSIAFQTNILALNAAVEAARAGEQGRGFAVVATEVRNLAQHSAASAKEIRDLIADSGAKVEQGSKQVNIAGQTMNELLTAVKHVNEIMADIAAASREQSAGIDQINQSIAQMDTVTQQNAALVDTMTASARALDEHAKLLLSSVNASTKCNGSKLG